MHPILIKIGNFVIYSYGVMMALALMVFSFYAMKFSDRFGLKKETVFDGILLGTLVAVLSARIAWVLVNISYFASISKVLSPWELLITLINVREGGLTIFGALLVVPIVTVWLANRRGEDPFRLLDLYAFAAPWAIVIGRLGCFLNGCCIGKPWSGPWAITFPNAIPPVPRHPTQLYELFAMLITGLAFLTVLLRGEKPIRFFGWFAISYGTVRFIIEFFRDNSPVVASWVTAGHVASLALILVGIGYLFLTPKTRRLEISEGGSV